MSTPEPRCHGSPAGSGPRPAGELTSPTPVDDRTIELATRELLLIDATSSDTDPDEIGPTVGGIPIRNQLAAARIAHALGSAREAQALIDEAVELVATVRGLHVETYQLGAARGALRDTIDRLGRAGRAAEDGGTTTPPPAFDLKSDPSYEEIAIWLSFGIPVTS